MKPFSSLMLAAAMFLTGGNIVAQPESRHLVELPPMMSQHMLANMRDHLMSLNAIQQALGDTDFDTAAEIAETRLGMSSLPSHNAAHMAPYMPQAMQAIGTQMHHAASRFAVIARETAVDGNMARALASLASVTKQCVTCHNDYRIR